MLLVFYCPVKSAILLFCSKVLFCYSVTLLLCLFNNLQHKKNTVKTVNSMSNTKIHFVSLTKEKNWKKRNIVLTDVHTTFIWATAKHLHKPNLLKSKKSMFKLITYQLSKRNTFEPKLDELNFLMCYLCLAPLNHWR